MGNAGAVVDPMGYLTPLTISATFHPLGFPVLIQTNSAGVIQAAEESWGEEPPEFPDSPIQLRIVVGGGPAGMPPTPVFRAQWHLLAVAADASNFAVCDLDGGLAFCHLSEAAAQRRAWVRYHFIEAIVYTALTHRRLTALHAACLSRNGSGVMLCGPPGCGKTTLAWACARAGWTFLADDATYLLRAASDRVVLGMPRQLRLLDDAPRLFPELAGRAPVLDVNGQRRLEIPAAEWGLGTARRCQVEAVVFLERSETAAARLDPLPRREALARLRAEFPAYSPPVGEQHLASLGRLLEAPCFELVYSTPGAAVAVLESLTEVVGSPCS